MTLTILKLLLPITKAAVYISSRHLDGHEFDKTLPANTRIDWKLREFCLPFNSPVSSARCNTKGFRGQSLFTSFKIF